MGYAASFQSRTGQALLREIIQNPPSAILIDLSRLPLQGRDVGVSLRLGQATRKIPLVFVDGLPEQVLIVRQTLPDAVYSTWTHLGEDLPKAIQRPPRDPIVPPVTSPGTVVKSMANKFGIQPGHIVALLNAPLDFIDMLGPLPDGVAFRRQLSDECDLILWFVRSRRELQDGIRLRAARLAGRQMWILWSKHTSGASGELSEANVRKLGLEEGLVVGKLASINKTWLGLLCVRQSQ